MKPFFCNLRDFGRFALVTALLLTAASCKKPETAADDAKIIKIGEYASLTGGTATFGQSSHAGTQMAIDDLNEKGGILGKKLLLLTEDDQSKNGEPALVVKKLITRDKVVAILGEVASTRSLEAAPICQELKIPMISPASTNPQVTEKGDYIFRICFIDPFQGTVMAKFCLDTLGKKRVAILTDVKTDYSVGLTKYFKEYLTANGGTIVSEQSYSSGEKDFNAQLTAIKSASPDAVFIPGYYGEVSLIALQARQLGLDVPLLGGDGWDSTLLAEVAGKSIEGNYFSNHFSTEDPDPNIQAFIARYKARFGTIPDAMAALGYDSAMILAAAIERAKSLEGSKIRDEIAKTKDYPGITGTITLDENRNANKPAVVLTIKDGKFQYVTTVR